MLLLQPTTAGCRKKFVGTEIAARIESLSQILHRGQIAFRKHLVHEVDFLHADAMFSRDGATTVQAFIQDFIAGEKYPLDLSSVTFIEQ